MEKPVARTTGFVVRVSSLRSAHNEFDRFARPRKTRRPQPRRSALPVADDAPDTPKRKAARFEKRILRYPLPRTRTIAIERLFSEAGRGGEL